jgi:hypothetical protein
VNISIEFALLENPIPAVKMRSSLLFGSLLLLSSRLFTSQAEPLEFTAQFGPSVAPFNIDVHPEFVKYAKLKASLTRTAVDVKQPDWIDGPPQRDAEAVKTYWANEYDWFEVQRDLNKQYRTLFDKIFICF